MLCGPSIRHYHASLQLLLFCFFQKENSRLLLGYCGGGEGRGEGEEADLAKGTWGMDLEFHMFLLTSDFQAIVLLSYLLERPLSLGVCFSRASLGFEAEFTCF